jgi:sulfate transporter 4
MMMLFQIAFPHTAVLGQLPGASTVYRNVKQYPDAQLCPGILAFRIGKTHENLL